MDTNVHHLWVLYVDAGTEYVQVKAACSDDTRIVERDQYEGGTIDPHFTSTDLCAHCVQVAQAVSV